MHAALRLDQRPPSPPGRSTRAGMQGARSERRRHAALGWGLLLAAACLAGKSRAERAAAEGQQPAADGADQIPCTADLGQGAQPLRTTRPRSPPSPLSPIASATSTAVARRPTSWPPPQCRTPPRANCRCASPSSTSAAKSTPHAARKRPTMWTRLSSSQVRMQAHAAWCASGGRVACGCRAEKSCIVHAPVKVFDGHSCAAWRRTSGRNLACQTDK